jgi:Tol biopolymer transport system component
LALLLMLAVLAPLADDAGAAFPGGPGPIAFQSTRAGGLSVWLVNPDGGGLRQFTPGDNSRNPRVRQYAPAISPNGRRVAYVASQERNGKTWRNVFVKGIGVRALNNPGRRVLRHPSPRPIESVAFAPGGRRLVFSAVPRRGGPDFELFTVRIGGGGLRQLTHNRVQDIEPNVSRRGLIAFAQLWDRGRPPLALFGRSNIALIRPGWRGRKLLTHTGRNGEDRDPAFAPAGNRVVHGRDFRDRSKPGRIMEADLNSNRSRAVFIGVDGRNRLDEPQSPAISPDGKTIVFARTFNDEWGQITNADLYEIGRDRQGLRYVTGLDGEYDTEPDWGARP